MLILCATINSKDCHTYYIMRKKTTIYPRLGNLVVDGDGGVRVVQGSGVSDTTAEGQVHGVGVGQLEELPGVAAVSGVVVVAVQGAAVLATAGDPGLCGGEHASTHERGAGRGGEHVLPGGATVAGGHGEGTLCKYKKQSWRQKR